MEAGTGMPLVIIDAPACCTELAEDRHTCVGWWPWPFHPVVEGQPLGTRVDVIVEAIVNAAGIVDSIFPARD